MMPRKYFPREMHAWGNAEMEMEESGIISPGRKSVREADQFTLWTGCGKVNQLLGAWRYCLDSGGEG
jgi:hypothetical protein